MEANLENPKPVYHTLADNWLGKRFNSPNDLCINREGTIYFTDPPYGMVNKWDDPKREIEFTGVFRIEPGRTDADLLIDSIQAPNGIGLSPDGRTLYIASSGPDCSLYKFELNGDKIDSGELFFDARELKKTRKGSCDGMYIRSDGTIFASGPGGILIFDPDGSLLGTVLTGQATSNCAIDEAGNWLYMTADMYLMRIKLK
jgi:gluconolactonase